MLLERRVVGALAGVVLLCALVGAAQGATYDYAGTIGSDGPVVQELDEFCVGPDGTVYVVDRSTPVIAHLSSDMRFIEQATVFAAADRWDRRFYLDTDGAGNVYLFRRDGDAAADATVYVLSRNLSVQGQWNAALMNPSPLTGSLDPNVFDVAPNGDVFIVDNGGYRVRRFSAQGSQLAWWGDASTRSDVAMHWCFVETDTAGNVYLFRSDRVVETYSRDGVLLTSFPAPGSSPALDWLHYIDGFAVDPAGRYVYLLEVWNGLKVHRYPAGGGASTVLSLPDPVPGLSLVNQNGVHRFTCDHSGSLYVPFQLGMTAGRGLYRVSPDGSVLAKWLRVAPAPAGRVIEPRDVAAGPGGDVFVADAGWSGVLHYSARGDYLSTIGADGNYPSRLVNPASVAIAGTSLYVLDDDGWGRGRIKRFGTDGTYLGEFGGSGTWLETCVATDSAGSIFCIEDGQVARYSSAGALLNRWPVMTPSGGISLGLAVDDHDNVYVTVDAWSDGSYDPPGDTVIKFSPDGRPVCQVGGAWGTDDGILRSPHDLATDLAGRIFVTDTMADLVAVYSDDRFLEYLGTAGSGPGQFNTPFGICSDGGFTLYVADSYNRRVQKFVHTRPTWPVSVDSAESLAPDVDGGTVAWQDARGGPGTWKVLRAPFAGGSVTTIAGADVQTAPSFDGGRVAFVSEMGGAQQVAVASSAGAVTVVTAGTAPRRHPRISGDLVVWEEQLGGYWQVMLHNLATHATIQVTSGAEHHINPAVDGGFIVWEDYRDGNPDVYLYDLGAGEERYVARGTARQTAPDIDGATVVYEQAGTIRWKNLVNGTTGTAPLNGVRPRISGPWAVYETTGTPGEIAGCHIPTGSCVLLTKTPAGGAATAPAIDGLNVVYEYRAPSSITADIWALTITEEPEPPITTPATPPPTTSPTPVPTVTTPSTPAPYRGHALPCTVEAEDYDLGGQSVAYLDRTPQNEGGVYRTDAVDIGGGPGAYHVGWISAGEWLQYTVQAPAGGEFRVTARYASQLGDQLLEFSVDDTVQRTVRVAGTGGFSTWADAVTWLNVPSGTHRIRVRFSGDGMNLDRLTFERVLALAAVPGGAGLPADTNGDGLYDDVNGNGRRDFADVVLYFNQMAWIAANEPVVCFDCNNNGRIDFADVVWLFNHL